MVAQAHTRRLFRPLNNLMRDRRSGEISNEVQCDLEVRTIPFNLEVKTLLLQFFPRPLMSLRPAIPIPPATVNPKISPLIIAAQNLDGHHRVRRRVVLEDYAQT